MPRKEEKTNKNVERAIFGSMDFIFQSRLNEIERRGVAAGLNFTDICRDLGISRATPDRWKKKTPMTVTLIDMMEDVVVRAERAVLHK